MSTVASLAPPNPPINSNSSSLPWQPQKSIGQGLYTIQGQGQHTTVLSTATVGMPYPYYPYAYGQPVPSLTSYIQSYNNIPYLPWGSLQPCQPITGITSYPNTSTQAQNDNLLDLSTSSKSKPITSKARSDSSRVARPVKRSVTSSGSGKVSNNSSHARKVETEGSEVMMNKEGEYKAPHVMAIQKELLKSNESPSTQTRNYSKQDFLKTNPNEQEKRSQVPLTELACNINKSFPSSKPSLITSDMIREADCHVTGKGDASIRSFPYRQHIQLPDGSCPLVHFPGHSSNDSSGKCDAVGNASAVFTWKDAIKQPAIGITSSSSCKKDSTDCTRSNMRLDNKLNTGITGIKSTPSCSTSLSNECAYETLQRTQSCSSIPAPPVTIEQETVDSAGDLVGKPNESKTKQVKIKLNKQGSSHFLAELMKLTSVYGGSATSNTAETFMSAYRPSVVNQCITGNILQGRAVNARQLLFTNSRAASAMEPQRKRFCSVPALRYSVLTGGGDSTSQNMVQNNFRSKSQSDMYQEQQTQAACCTLIQETAITKTIASNNSTQPKPGLSHHQKASSNLIRPTSVAFEKNKFLINDRALLQAIRDRFVQPEVRAPIQAGQAMQQQVQTASGQWTTLSTSIHCTAESSTDRHPNSEVNHASVRVINNQHSSNSKFQASDLNQGEQPTTENMDICDTPSELSIPGSGASSLSLSPYLLGLLPDRLDEEVSDDVFIEESVPSDITAGRPRLYSAPVSAQYQP